MKRRHLALFAGISSLFLIGASCGNSAINTTSNISSQSTSTTQTRQKFSDSPDYPYAVLISTDTLSAIAKTALIGFDLSKTSQSDGSTVYTLKAKESTYQDQTYTVKKGQSLYFIESSGSDDQGNSDLRLNDDTAVVVDADGYTVTQ